MAAPVVNVDEVEFRPRSAAVPGTAAKRFEASFASEPSSSATTSPPYHRARAPSPSIVIASTRRCSSCFTAPANFG